MEGFGKLYCGNQNTPTLSPPLPFPFTQVIKMLLVLEVKHLTQQYLFHNK